MNSKDINKLRMTFISPKTVKYSPVHIHFPHGPNGSLSFPEEKAVEKNLFGLATYLKLSRILIIPKNYQNFIQIGPILENL